MIFTGKSSRHSFTHVPMYTYLYVYVHVYVYVFICIYTDKFCGNASPRAHSMIFLDYHGRNSNARAYTYIYTYTYICVYIYLCIFIHVYVYIQVNLAETHIHVPSWRDKEEANHKTRLHVGLAESCVRVLGVCLSEPPRTSGAYLFIQINSCMTISISTHTYPFLNTYS